MKIINLNNENIVKCKCGAIFEYEKSDLLFAKTELSNPFYDLSVRCPKCFNFISVHDNRNVFSISEFDETINKNFKYKRIMLKDGSVVTLDIIGKDHDVDENGHKTNETNKEGKARRTQAKSILLGILYRKRHCKCSRTVTYN